MTDREIADLGPAFSRYLQGYRACFLQGRSHAHFDNYCRGLLSDLPRKSVEPIALACGTAVRTLQEFLVTADWDHDQARDLLHAHVKDHLAGLPPDDLGTVGVIDETSCRKKGARTPGVQRQYLGCVGKIDNGIVTVHTAVAHGRFQALLDSDLFLPEAWDQDRDRCQAAGIPDAKRYRARWKLALDQFLRLHENGIRFDWLTFDEDYGSKVPFLDLLSLVGQKFVAEVPVSFRVRTEAGGKSRRADSVLTAADARRGRWYRLQRLTTNDQRWRALRATVWVRGRQYVLVVARNGVTGEVKYFVSNATGESVKRLLRVAFRRATIEHGLRLGKQEAGLMHYEGRRYEGLIRHLILALVVLGFVATHTDRLRGEKPAVDAGAGVPGTEPALRADTAEEARDSRGQASRAGHPVSPTPQQQATDSHKKRLPELIPEPAL
jgi:SRSO17 transposase